MPIKRKAYPFDLTDAEWNLLAPVLPPVKARGRRRRVNLREIVNAIFYVLRTGCQWDYLPHDFPPPDTVYGYFRDWKNDGTWGRWNEVLRGQVRQSVGKEVEPSAGVIDSRDTAGEFRSPIIIMRQLELAQQMVTAGFEHAADQQATPRLEAS